MECIPTRVSPFTTTRRFFSDVVVLGCEDFLLPCLALPKLPLQSFPHYADVYSVIRQGKTRLRILVILILLDPRITA